MKNLVLVLLALFLIQTAAYAKKGVELQVEVKDDSQTEITKMIVLDKKLKIEIINDKSEKDFVTFDGQKMCTVDNERKECNCMKKEDIKKMAAEINKQFAAFDMEEMLKDVPPAQREMVRQQMEKMMPKKAAPAKVSKPDLTKIGNENYNNYPSRKYLLKSSGEKTYLWVTDWGNINGGKEISNAFTSLGSFFDEMLEITSQLPGAQQREQDNFMSIMDDVNGLIHSSKEYENGKLTSESRLIKSFKRDVSQSEFNSPYSCKNPLNQL